MEIHVQGWPSNPVEIQEDTPVDNETLTITDNRTNQTYTVPISRGTIRAMDLRQIKTGADDFGLMTYDPAFMNRSEGRRVGKECRSRWSPYH